VFANTAMNTTTIPSAVVLALFAYLGTRVVARYGLGERE
jgi:multisubunit Na+/H+ antiporter MnhF subunit